MQTIETKYIGPSNVRGSRVKATHTGGVKSVTLSWDDALDSESNHQQAAWCLMNRLDWHGTMAGGESPSKRGMVWVFVDKYSPTIQR